MTAIKYRTADVDGFNIFYREAGPPGAPKLLLLHAGERGRRVELRLGHDQRLALSVV